ncbi:uncharacterized protein NEPG_01668 [Nematocida parisii ERTm1]|uniref:Mediator of RNA polymerase II transcription subunit 14 n=1 Tax=Nematocida parisii (strain ERTm3) TaxID=935791 RepID=I3EIS3_NEMP3|nr:uncharacterized protein NEPG_01668 [Nematocida parisii ERTm1]EIJ89120.1 hypothetical protein NEQG_00939 [Nematocida parisii ERTm3]EIJ93326.1 hypothetical protein NEPG_01668 [Nematocida parisii ERTm1]KAI5145455.1 hypothetical protein NEPAR07_1697 [Nematocida parisii]|eukprot:XP_013059496.1 hypothetical protein NEPG_01668 [Nematocida parisii ERTm1]
MKVKVQLSQKRESLTVQLSTAILNEREPKRININTIILNKMKYLLNLIYLITIEDVKEQERRRKIIRLYIKETNELIKIVTMLLSVKHGHHINNLERKVLRLHKYNTEQEELADKLVYLCNDLKLQASSSYDIPRAFKVLLSGRSDFPSEIIRLANELTKEKESRFGNAGSNPMNERSDKSVDYTRLDQLLVLHIKRSGIWTDENVFYTVRNGVVELTSYGFKSTLILSITNNIYSWSVLSIKHTDDTKNIPIKGIVFKNTIKEIVDMTKYTDSVIKIEEISRVLRSRIENKIFDMEISGTTKNFVLTILGVFKIFFKIDVNWDGPSIICQVTYKNTREILKSDFINKGFEIINSHLQKSVSEHAYINFEKGLFYKDRLMFTMRDLQKEALLEKSLNRIAAPGVITKEKINILCNGTIVQLNVLMRMDTSVFVGLHWETEKKGARIFYGIYQTGSLLVGTEMLIRYSTAPIEEPRRQSTMYTSIHNEVCDSDYEESSDERSMQDSHMPREHYSGPISFSERENYIGRASTPNTPNENLFLDTMYSSTHLINYILQNPKHLLTAVSLYHAVRLKGKHSAKSRDDYRITLCTSFKLILFKTVILKLGGSTGQKLFTKIVSKRVGIEDYLSTNDIIKITWLAVVAKGLTSTRAILPSLHKKIGIEGRLEKNKYLLFKGKINFAIKYANGKILCTSANYAVALWAASILNQRIKESLFLFFDMHRILMYPGLVTTIPLHNMLGGQLKNTCNTSILYRVTRHIEVYWHKKAEKVEQALKNIPKIAGGLHSAAISLEYLDGFLSIISKLLSQERIQELGPHVRVGKNEKEYAVYSLRLENNKLFAYLAEKGNINIHINIEEILQKSPDAEKTLLEHNLYLFPY